MVLERIATASVLSSLFSWKDEFSRPSTVLQLTASNLLYYVPIPYRNGATVSSHLAPFTTADYPLYRE